MFFVCQVPFKFVKKSGPNFDHFECMMVNEIKPRGIL